MLIGKPETLNSIGPTYRFPIWSGGNSVNLRRPPTTHAMLLARSK
jgi:hypothetical protein